MNDPTEPDAGSPWPAYDLVAVRCGPSVPPLWAARLAAAAVPRGCIGREYRALPEAALLGGIAGRQLIAFGAAGFFGRVCVDAETGAVVHVATATGPAANVVNADLGAFRECVAAVIARFPFYGEDDEPERFEEAAGELRRVISAIDESALRGTGFWVTFADDVAVGDYATEMIV